MKITEEMAKNVAKMAPNIELEGDLIQALNPALIESFKNNTLATTLKLKNISNNTVKPIVFGAYKCLTLKDLIIEDLAEADNLHLFSSVKHLKNLVILTSRKEIADKINDLIKKSAFTSLKCTSDNLQFFLPLHSTIEKLAINRLDENVLNLLLKEVPPKCNLITIEAEEATLSVQESFNKSSLKNKNNIVLSIEKIIPPPASSMQTKTNDVNQENIDEMEDRERLSSAASITLQLNEKYQEKSQEKSKLKKRKRIRKDKENVTEIENEDEIDKLLSEDTTTFTSKTKPIMQTEFAEEEKVTSESIPTNVLFDSNFYNNIKEIVQSTKKIKMTKRQPLIEEYVQLLVDNNLLKESNEELEGLIKQRNMLLSQIEGHTPNPISNKKRLFDDETSQTYSTHEKSNLR